MFGLISEDKYKALKGILKEKPHTALEIQEALDLSVSTVKKLIAELIREKIIGSYGKKDRKSQYHLWEELSQERQDEIIVNTFLKDKAKSRTRLAKRQIEQVLSDLGCKIIIPYKDFRHAMKYKCREGHIIKIMPGGILRLFNRKPHVDENGIEIKFISPCVECNNAKLRDIEKCKVEKTMAEIGFVLLSPFENCRTPCTYKCDKGHINHCIIQSSRLNCQQCSESLGEKKIRKFLGSNNISFKKEFVFGNSVIGRRRFDFAIKDTPCLIEYQGEGHFFAFSFHGGGNKYKQLMKSMIGDEKKFQFCKKHNIPLLLIPYWEKSRIEEIITQFLKGDVPKFDTPPPHTRKALPIRNKIRQHLGHDKEEHLYGAFNLPHFSGSYGIMNEIISLTPDKIIIEEDKEIREKACLICKQRSDIDEFIDNFCEPCYHNWVANKKICVTCEEVKNVSEFKKIKNKIGFSATCKSCRSEKERIAYKEGRRKRKGNLKSKKIRHTPKSIKPTFNDYFAAPLPIPPCEPPKKKKTGFVIIDNENSERTKELRQLEFCFEPLWDENKPGFIIL